MKTKKGFTLVELLAVVAILAVIVIIALPNVMGMFNKSKENTFTTELKNIYRTAESQWISESMFNTEEKVYSRCKSGCNNLLKLSGREELEYYIKLDKTGKVVEFYATDGTYQFEHNGDLLLTNIQGVEKISELGKNDIFEIKNNNILINDISINLGKICVVNNKSYNSNKEYYFYTKGESVQSWNSSSNNTSGIILNGFVDTSDNYSDITDLSEKVKNSDEGCYYPKMVTACAMSNYAKETKSGTTMNSVKTTFEIPEGIKVSAFDKSIFKTNEIKYNQFLNSYGLFTTSSVDDDIMYASSEGCYFNGEILTTGTPVTVYPKNSSTLTCYSNQTVGECLKDTPIGGLKTYYGSKGVGLGHNYAVSSMILVEPGQKYYTEYGLICLDGESEVEVYDKKKKKKLKKKLKDVTDDDLILCWDFDLGRYTYQKPVWIMKPKRVSESIVLTFSDGSILKIAGDHRIYNLDSQMFTSGKSETDSPIGMRTINSKGEIITLVSREIVKENMTICNVATYKDINIYANGILTSRGSNNLYKINNMKFVKDDRETLNREDLPDVSNDIYYGLRLGERNIDVYGSKENAIHELEIFAEELESLKK